MPKSTDLPAIHEWSQGTGLPWDVEHLFIIQHSKPFPSVAFCPCPIFSTSILYYNPMQLICRIGLLHPSVDGLSVLFNSSSLRCDAPPLTGRKPTATFHSNSTQHHSGPWETVKTIVALKRFSSIKAIESNSIVPWLVTAARLTFGWERCKWVFNINEVVHSKPRVTIVDNVDQFPFNDVGGVWGDLMMHLRRGRKLGSPQMERVHLKDPTNH